MPCRLWPSISLRVVTYTLGGPLRLSGGHLIARTCANRLSLYHPWRPSTPWRKLANDLLGHLYYHSPHPITYFPHSLLLLYKASSCNMSCLPLLAVCLSSKMFTFSIQKVETKGLTDLEETIGSLPVSTTPNDQNSSTDSYIKSHKEEKCVNSTLVLRWMEKVSTGIRLVGRFLRMLARFTPLLLAYPVARVWPWTKDEDEGVARWWWQFLVFSLERSGPTAIKFSQWASTRRDLFTNALCNHLSVLHSSAPPHSFSHTRTATESAFGQRLEELFDSLDPHPIGSGCVAQVHRGVLHRSDNTSGQEVVVKVIHPMACKYIQQDLAIMRLIAHTINWLPGMRWFGLVESVEQFAHVMSNQLDLRIEAANLDRFNENFKNDDSVIFPHPISPYVSREVLIETYEEGIPIGSLIPRTEEERTGDQGVCVRRYRRHLARIGLNAFLRMILVDRFVHGDLHPGNILVRGGPTNHGPPQLIFLDAGIVIALSKRDGANFYDLFDAIIRNDGQSAGMLMIQNAREHECKDPEAFSLAIGGLVAKVHSKSFSMAVVDVGAIMSKVLSLVRDYKVLIEANYASLVLGVVVIEGLGRSLDPSLDIIKASIPILALARIEYYMESLACNDTKTDTDDIRDWTWTMFNSYNGLAL